MEAKKYETKTFLVEEVSFKEGDNKKGHWKLTSFRATDGNRYSSFDSKLDPAVLSKGVQITAEVSPSNTPNNYDIKKIITYKLIPPKASIEKETKDLGNEPIIKHPDTTKPVADRVKDAEAYVRRLIDSANQMGLDYFEAAYDAQSPEYIQFVSTTIQIMHSKIVSDRIAQQEADKMKAYGGNFK